MPSNLLTPKSVPIHLLPIESTAIVFTVLLANPSLVVYLVKVLAPSNLLIPVSVPNQYIPCGSIVIELIAGLDILLLAGVKVFQ